MFGGGKSSVIYHCVMVASLDFGRLILAKSNLDRRDLADSRVVTRWFTGTLMDTQP